MSRSVAGVGIGLRRPLADAILATERHVDFLELIPEAFLELGGYARYVLDGCAERWPLLSHGVCLSLGGPDPLDARYLERLARLLDRLDAPFFTDHACFAKAHGLYFQDLLPMPFTDEAVSWMAERARRAVAAVGRPLALENITYYAEMPGAELSEGEFLRRLLEAADCGLLLDVNNVYVNALNHGRDPEQALRALPLERTVQIHLAGHHAEDGLLVDTHGAAVCREVWALYALALREIGPRPTLIEWDTHLPPLDVIIDQADRARALLSTTTVRERSPRAAPGQNTRAPAPRLP
jgi:uncharacterized protein (UPF0276 family)